jgi:hypothetical protein
VARDDAPYDAEITKLKAKAPGKGYGATESVFDYMAAVVAWKIALRGGIRMRLRTSPNQVRLMSTTS